ncbi:GL27033 [Drosophila persimilis]|uniref:GL27033 n=1 Tax=Drosophila persimilis TaxID=7234 RepID=B4H7I6_DROPE|nr:GL27033 [Drosophila persimilis]
MSPTDLHPGGGAADDYHLAASTSGGGDGGGGGEKLKDMPEKYVMAIVNFLDWHVNATADMERLNLKASIKSVYWLFLIQYAALALLGVILNIAIIVYIMYHRLYKDVTHSFLINLALCHFVQCALVLPVSLMVMLIQNWIFGQFLCFFLPMLQDIPLHVAMISHILIAWDRMRWLNDPLKGRLPGFVCCCATWLTGMVIALPYPIYTFYVELGDYMPQLAGIGLCVVNLMDDMQEYTRGLFLLMYCGPAILLSYLYIRTSQELRPPEGPFAVMMYEHRADLRMRQRDEQERLKGLLPASPRRGRRRASGAAMWDAEPGGGSRGGLHREGRNPPTPPPSRDTRDSLSRSSSTLTKVRHERSAGLGHGSSR